MVPNYQRLGGVQDGLWLCAPIGVYLKEKGLPPGSEFLFVADMSITVTLNLTVLQI